jgi:DNA-3-methyladenine glycosylase
MARHAPARLDRAFFARPVRRVARDLLGCTVRHGDTAGIIVETEAYHESEPACHAYIGPTAHNEVVFGPPGIAYIYRSYGIHALLNAVTNREGEGAAVLIRALEPVDGIELMRLRRGPVADGELCNGPGKLTEALGIGLELHATDLVSGPIAIEPRAAPAPRVVASARIGITKAPDLPWRYSVAGNRHVSRPRPAVTTFGTTSRP